MKKIGIVVAVVREFKSFLEDRDFTTEMIKVNHHEVFKFILADKEVYIIRSGNGEIDASAATQLLITKFDCEYIFNYGVTGALDKNLTTKELFVVNKVLHYDYDVSMVDPLKPHQYYEFKDEYIKTDSELKDFVLNNYKNTQEVICASGDKFITDKSFKEELNKIYGAQICDMESAGIVRTCYKNRVKCLIIKSISDVYDGDNNDYEENVIESSNRAFKLLKDTLIKI